MSTYLSTTDIFLAPTPEIRALQDKSILIVTPSGDQMLAKIGSRMLTRKVATRANASSLSGPPQRMNVSGLTLARVVRLRRQNRTGGHSFLRQTP